MMMHTTRSRTMNTMMPITSGETAGAWVFDGDEEEFVGALVGDSGAVGEGVGDAVGDGDGDGVGDAVVGDGVVGDGDGDGVGEGVGENVGAGVVGAGVGVFGPVHVTGGLHGPELRHAGHISPFVHAELGERVHSLVKGALSMPQIPTPAPVNLLSRKRSWIRFVSRPISSGIDPFSALLPKFSMVNPVICARSAGGMGPVSPLPSMNKQVLPRSQLQPPEEQFSPLLAAQFFQYRLSASAPPAGLIANTEIKTLSIVTTS